MAGSCLVFVRFSGETYPCEVPIEASVATVLDALPSVGVAKLAWQGTVLNGTDLLADLGIGMQATLEGMDDQGPTWDPEWGGALIEYAPIVSERTLAGVMGVNNAVEFHWGPETADATLYRRITPPAMPGRPCSVRLSFHKAEGAGKFPDHGCRVAMAEDDVHTGPESALGNHEGAAGILASGSPFTKLSGCKAVGRCSRYTECEPCTFVLDVDAGSLTVQHAGDDPVRVFKFERRAPIWLAVCAYDPDFAKCVIVA
eukprot:TRINITY_DN1562_c0_g1_i3.p2 TRINITY_DN1562_c0_g1~~TRINITY_DN1562_c0_g1_i3.p2  ORF type:complete len:280 (+),score=53.50 TRINITY_DN1562_c0_g1_i3:72-842(+)